jgi:hypothetical protein
MNMKSDNIVELQISLYYKATLILFVGLRNLRQKFISPTGVGLGVHMYKVSGQ